jgi:hypothetical protein
LERLRKLCGEAAPQVLEFSERYHNKLVTRQNLIDLAAHLKAAEKGGKG